MRKIAALLFLTLALTPSYAAEKDLPDYTITVSLSDKAAAKLESSGEWVHISAFYYGLAIKPKDGDEMGQIWLGNEDADIKGAGTVTFGHIKIDTGRLRKVVGGKPTVNINVYSSRKKFQDNLLDCGLFEDLVDIAVKTNAAIACKLIGEE